MSKSDSTQNLPSSFALPPQLLAQAADTYRHPAPPPQLPAVQLVPRHQEPVINPKEKHSPNGYPPNGAGVGIVRCPEGRAWQERNMHAGEKLGRFRDQDVDGFVADMAMVLRKEYDCWVEQCWYVLWFLVMGEMVIRWRVLLTFCSQARSFPSGIHTYPS